MDIGKTRSGTIVEYKPNQTTVEFSQEFMGLSDADKFDVYCIYQFLFVRARPMEDVKPDEYDWWLKRMDVCGKSSDQEKIEEEKLKANVRTSYEMVQFGKKMINNFWRHF